MTAGSGVQLPPPLQHTAESTSVFLTGGIGELYYHPLAVDSLEDVARFGDVGPLLAESLRRNDRLRRLTVREPPETLRATVLGAAGQTVTLSGSTIWVAKDLLPLRNLPVLRPAMPGRGGGPTFAEAVKEGIAKASETVHGIKGAWVSEESVVVENNAVTEFRVTMRVSFVLA